MSGERQHVRRPAPAPRPGSGIDASGHVTAPVESAIRARSGRGVSLSPGMASWARSALGMDAGGVGVHTGPDAHALARSVSATAFTVGRDIFFSGGSYQPHTGSGQRLIAHELTHVAQQSRMPASGGRLRVNDPGDRYEREADRIAGGGGA